MANRALQRCLKLAHSPASRFYHSSGPPCLTVAKLLNSSPSDRSVAVNGFIRSIRNQKARSFAVIGDGTSLEPLQALLTPVQAQRYVFFSTLALEAQFCLVSPLDLQSLSLAVGQCHQTQGYRPMSCM
jgi:hypothetical protein